MWWLIAVGGLLVAGVTYAWLNGWLSRREEHEEAEHAGQVTWEGEPVT